MKFEFGYISRSIPVPAGLPQMSELRLADEGPVWRLRDDAAKAVTETGRFTRKIQEALDANAGRERFIQLWIEWKGLDAQGARPACWRTIACFCAKPTAERARSKEDTQCDRIAGVVLAMEHAECEPQCNACAAGSAGSAEAVAQVSI